MVNHPSHYNKGEIEVIDIIELIKAPYHIGNAIKYICRSDSKGSELEDLKKALWYLNRTLSAQIMWSNQNITIHFVDRFVKSQNLNLNLSVVLTTIIRPGDYISKREDIQKAASILSTYVSILST